jgi:poly-gamma-glutamate capsule biosynthesis protein CapA/YwtB (metallophosphatase superfamily)
VRRSKYLSLPVLLVLLASAGLACGGGRSAYTEPTPASPVTDAATHGPGPATAAADRPATHRPDARTSATPEAAAATPTRTVHPAPGRPIGQADPKLDVRPITLTFAGDIQFEGHIRPLLDRPGTALAPIKDELSGADLTIANLETAITTRGRAEDKNYTFRAAPAAFDALAAAGVDVVSMANNHGVDFGPEGLADTLAAIPRASLAVVGIGADADQAFAPYVATVRGTRIAVLGATAFDDPTSRNYPAADERAGVAVALEPARLVSAVRQARRSSDIVVVYLHWGIELEQCPTDEQQELARTLADAGADIVVGSHAHVLLGAGLLDKTFVGYGLGNFVWKNRNSVAETTTGVLTLTMTGQAVDRADWSPATVGADGLPHFATGARAEEMRRDFAGLRSCADLSAVPGVLRRS